MYDKEFMKWYIGTFNVYFDPSMNLYCFVLPAYNIHVYVRSFSSVVDFIKTNYGVGSSYFSSQFRHWKRRQGVSFDLDEVLAELDKVLHKRKRNFNV